MASSTTPSDSSAGAGRPAASVVRTATFAVAPGRYSARSKASAIPRSWRAAATASSSVRDWTSRPLRTCRVTNTLGAYSGLITKRTRPVCPASATTCTSSTSRPSTAASTTALRASVFTTMLAVSPGW